jgi:hypothetical protein
VAAVEVQLECVDPSKRSCVEPIEVRRYGLPTWSGDRGASGPSA